MEQIRRRQPNQARRAAGFLAWKPFAHKAKHRVAAGRGEQGTRTTAMAELQKVSGKVDVARYNWPGLCGVQAICGMFDPRPRLVKRQQTQG